MTNEKDFQAGFEKGRVEGVLAERARVVALLRKERSAWLSEAEIDLLDHLLEKVQGPPPVATPAAVLTYGEHGLEPVPGAVALVRKETP